MKVGYFNIEIHVSTISLANGQSRRGAFVCVTDEWGNSGWGEIAPLPYWSQETFDDALQELEAKQELIKQIAWTAQDCFQQLESLNLLPSVSFGLESALLALLAPLPEHTVVTSALFMGSVPEILQQAKCREQEGYRSAKLKVSHLSFEEAEHVIHALKDRFFLRIDVNRAWKKEDALRFFAQFPLDAFDYVEEPFQNPRDLAEFTHPLAVDESFPQHFTLEELASLPTLKALIYKPTIQGGMLKALPLRNWASAHNINLVLSSSFESDLGLLCVASLARRLSLFSPVGLGTYHYLERTALQFSGPTIHIPADPKCLAQP